MRRNSNSEKKKRKGLVFFLHQLDKQVYDAIDKRSSKINAHFLSPLDQSRF